MQREPNKHVLNNTTVQHLGNSEDPIEVFPPEIFFKGKSKSIRDRPSRRPSRYRI